jgi:phosphoribosylformylglycinamidine synthase II
MLNTEIKVTAEIAAEHGLSADEYARIQQILGRAPNITELGIFSVMWSEHCSYKSSKVHLKRLPTEGPRVVQGPGENAGVVEIGDGLVAVFKIESHNHPSFVEPFQGAATGVGGILRDIFTMGARPIAVMDALRFGPIVEGLGAGGSALGEKQKQETPTPEVPRSARDDKKEQTDAATVARNRRILVGVVRGIAHYGNCFGVPTVGGDVQFEASYSANPLVNALALGIARREELFFARARGAGNPVIYAGAKTGRDGIHGASLLASAEFTEESQQKRPNVQVGDPFMEKLLLEACLEAMQGGAVVAIQDMGAAGLTCSTCEMGSRGGTGIEIELDTVPQRETGMTPYEIMLSESQERMLLVAERGREPEVLAVFAKWGLDAVVIGQVTADGLLRVRHHGNVVAEIPAHPLAEEGPVYQRPMKAPEPRKDERLVEFAEEIAVAAAGAEVDEEKSTPEIPRSARDNNLTDNFKKLLASPAIASKRWVYEQYDFMVRTNTLVGPGAGDAAVLRVKGTKRALALATDCNGRWCRLNPRTGAMHAVAEAARNVACSGARPIAATNCLNFGNPEKPEIMWQFSEAIDGMSRACRALGVPITGGNVSFYNETLGRPIDPTPMVGVLGVLEDAERALGMAFRSDGDAILLLIGFDERSGPREASEAERGGAGSGAHKRDPARTREEQSTAALLRSAQDMSRMTEMLRREFSSSEYAKTVRGIVAGEPPAIDLESEKHVIDALVALAGTGLLRSAHDVSDGGAAVTVAECCFASADAGALLGAEVNLEGHGPAEAVLFGERGGRAVVSVAQGDIARVQDIAREYGVAARRIGRVGRSELRIRHNGTIAVSAPVEEFRGVWANALQQALGVGE